MGRKALEFNDLQKAQVEALAAYLTLEQIADYFGICRKTLQNMRNRDPEIDTLYRQGKAKSIAGMAGSLIEQGMSGNVTAQKFYLATQAGWREAEPEHTNQPITLQIVKPDGAD